MSGNRGSGASLICCDNMQPMRNTLFWGMFPFLLPQALYVRGTAPRFAPAGGPAEGSVGTGTECRLLAVGDSIIAGVGAAQLSNALVGQTAVALAKSLDCGVSWHARGVSGYKTRTVLEQLVPELPDDPVDFIIISVGVNDVTGLTRLGKWRQNLSRLHDSLKGHSPGAAVAFAGIPPMHLFPLLPQPLRSTLGMRARLFDEELETFVDGYRNAVHVPVHVEPDRQQFASDGFHPSEEGYAEFGRHMAEGLLRVANR